jgi:DNA invertase Pin-like site-specific DNA recombinase
MHIGYARTSTTEQNFDLQVDALKREGCEEENIYTDQLSGAAQARPGLDQALKFLRLGDTLVIWKLDRLGRSVKGLIELVDKLHERGVHFKSITDGIDTSTPAGRFFFHVMAALAQMERELILERTKAGLAAAKARGRLGGRKPKLTEVDIASAQRLLHEMTVKEVASVLKVSRATLYRSLASLNDS